MATASITTAMTQLSAWVTAHSTFTTFLTAIIVTHLFFTALLHLTQSPAEPPPKLATIPFLSPIIAMTKHSMDFYTHIYTLTRNLPIYTLRLPNNRIYIVNSTSLIPLIQRQYKKLIFAPVTVQALEGAFGVGKEVVKLAREDMITEEGFVGGLNKALHPVLAAGSDGLGELNRRAVGVLGSSLDEVTEKGRVKVKLYEWIKHEVNMSISDAVYGMGKGQNPMREVEIEEAWNTYSPSIMFLVLNLFPLAWFRKAIRARDFMAARYRQYYHQNKHNWENENDDTKEKDSRGPSEYLKAWTRHMISMGRKNPHVPVESAMGHLFVGSLFPLVANMVPACYWMVYRVFSEPEILNACREEVSQAVKTEGDNTMVLDADHLRRSCPLLVSIFQEVFRVHGMANSVRIAEEDHVLETEQDDGTRRNYLIKKGGMIMIPARVQHRMKQVWGEDVNDFDHRRFLKENLKDKAGGKRYNPVAFRGFGGGTTLCPGRHFATTEMVVLTALLLLRFDIVPTGDGGKWVLPTTANSSQAEAIEQPDFDIVVELRPREEVLGVKWRVSFDEDVQARLVAEDL